MIFPPGPDLPMKEQVHALMNDPLVFLDKCYRTHGEIFTLTLGDLGKNESLIEHNDKWVFLTRPDHIQTLFKADPEVALAGVSNKIYFGVKNQAGGIIRLDGPAHKEIARLYQPIFKGARMKAYTDTMKNIAEENLKTWPRGEAFSLLPKMQRITIKVIIAAIYGITDSAEADHICSLLMQLENARVTWDQRLEVEREISRLIFKNIDQWQVSESGQVRDDVFSLLMRAKKSDGAHLTGKEVHDEMLTLLKAGFGTTATTLAWIFAEVLASDEIQTKIMTEMGRVVGDEVLNKSHIPQFSYMDAVIMETLRLHPISPGGGARYLARPLQIGDYLLPKGTNVTNCPYLLHRRPELFNEPLRFNPDRYKTEKTTAYTWTPFGGGKRMCTGRPFAMQEMKVVMAVVFSNYRLRLARPVKRAERQGFFLAPDGGGPFVNIAQVLD